jgi:hypothetical protein
MSKSPKYLRFNQVIDRMCHHGACLAMMYTARGKEFYTHPHGDRVKPDDAMKIIARHDVHAMDDGLFPGLQQTWRMVRQGSPKCASVLMPEHA